jgi:hypothetical protein
LASECGHSRARLDSRDRASERCQRARRLAGTAPYLERRRLFVNAGDGDEIREQLVGISRSDPVVQLRHFVEHSTEVTIRDCHCTILRRQERNLSAVLEDATPTDQERRVARTTTSCRGTIRPLWTS